MRIGGSADDAGLRVGDDGIEGGALLPMDPMCAEGAGLLVLPHPCATGCDLNFTVHTREPSSRSSVLMDTSFAEPSVGMSSCANCGPKRPPAIISDTTS